MFRLKVEPVPAHVEHGKIQFKVSVKENYVSRASRPVGQLLSMSYSTLSGLKTNYPDYFICVIIVGYRAAGVVWGLLPPVYGHPGSPQRDGGWYRRHRP